MCIKTWVKKRLPKFTRTCNGDVMRTMTNKELARILSLTAFKYHPRLANAIANGDIEREQQYWLRYLDEEI